MYFFLSSSCWARLLEVATWLPSKKNFLLDSCTPSSSSMSHSYSDSNPSSPSSWFASSLTSMISWRSNLGTSGWPLTSLAFMYFFFGGLRVLSSTPIRMDLNYPATLNIKICFGINLFLVKYNLKSSSLKFCEIIKVKL